MTVRERWEAVVKEYTEKGAYMQTDMHAKFLASRCPDTSPKGTARCNRMHSLAVDTSLSSRYNALQWVVHIMQSVYILMQSLFSSVVDYKTRKGIV